MLGNLFSRFQGVTLARPHGVLALAAALSAFALILALGVEFRSSRSELAPADDPDQLRWESLLRDYKASETVIVCVEAAPGASAEGSELERFADRLAARIAADSSVERVFHRFDVDWVLRHGLWLMPTDQRRAIAAAVEAERELLEQLAGTSDLAGLNRRIAGRMRRDLGKSELPDEVGAGLSLLSAYLSAQRRFLEETGPAVERWVGRPPLAALAGDEARLANGYSKSHDGRTLFLIVTPRSTDDGLAERRAMLASLRGHVDAEQASPPRFKVAFTGTPAMSVEEMDTVRRDTLRTSAVAVIGVVLLTLLVFRWKAHAVLVLASLALGVLWAFGAVRLELGYLNLITSAFISTLIGVGVAYGIHPVSEYELEGAHTGNPAEAVRESYRRTGPAIAAAGLTTAAAFFSILLMRFRGFAELGLVAGVGVLLCLLSMMVVLPATLLLYGRRRRQRDRVARTHVVPLDRLWLERVAGRVCRAPRATILLAAAVTLLLGWAATGLRFNTNILDLLPRNSEALEYQRRMALESDLSPVFNLVVAENLGELDAMQKRATVEPAIERFESALRFLPRETADTEAMLASWNGWLDRLELPAAARPLSRDELAASLQELAAVLEEAADAAFTAGLGAIAGPLEEALLEAEACRDAALGADNTRVAAWNDGQRELLAWIKEMMALLREATAALPPSPETMPEELRARFFTGSGKPLGFLFPAESVFDPLELDRYVAASLRVSGEAIGFPFMFHKMSNRITSGFYRAVAAGALVVFIILLIDFRNLRHALFAALPLVIGMVWTLGAMRLLGLDFNFANLVAVPLIVGVGIDNGVHVMHRIRLEGEAGIDVVLRHTGRAILIASLTTMIGFGSLSLASHRGLESLGLLLLIGVGSCLIASVVVLPNLLVLTGQVK